MRPGEAEHFLECVQELPGLRVSGFCEPGTAATGPEHRGCWDAVCCHCLESLWLPLNHLPLPGNSPEVSTKSACLTLPDPSSLLQPSAGDLSGPLSEGLRLPLPLARLRFSQPLSRPAVLSAGRTLACCPSLGLHSAHHSLRPSQSSAAGAFLR